MLTRPGDRLPSVVGVPAYGYPAHTTMWNELALLGDRTIVVLNPASGPGTAVDPLYERVLAPLASGPQAIYGYVDTDYGRRPAIDVLADVDRYRAWYRPDGIFLDQVPSAVETVPYVTGLAAEMRVRGLQVALNPGQPEFDRRLVDAADYIVNFEGPADVYEATRFPEWAVADERSPKFWHLVYEVPDARAMDAVLRRAGANGATAVFVTDRTMPNPWDALPPYWKDQIQRVHPA